ncbi:MAG: thioredoxin [Rhodospirillales bacterium]|nr:thioredoxin [Rhodospirillales bacterium]
MDLPADGLALVLKEDCPTCQLIAPVAAELKRLGDLKAIYSQDNPEFPRGLAVIDDRDLQASFALETDIVPTLIRREGGRETGRVIGWHRGEWQNLTGVNDLGIDLPEERPGCGSLSVASGMAEELQARFGDTGLSACKVIVDFPDDPMEYAFDQGWTDGLPVVTPTPARVLRMLDGTGHKPDEVLGIIPPSGATCTVEKAAINAVMAGCRPEHLPVVLAALDAAMDPDFAWQGLMSTTMGAGVCVVVNGPVAKRIGMNTGHNALGHGNRANATIARALQLLVINLGGAMPGGTDRSTFGHPGKFGLCFAEDESDDAWQSLAQSRGIEPGKSAVTVFGFCGTSIHNMENAREPDALTDNIAMTLNAFGHPQDAGGGQGAMLVLSGEYWSVYRAAGWDRARIFYALMDRTGRNEADVEAGATVRSTDGTLIPKFGPGDLQLVRTGSNAGLFSTIIHGWASGPRGSQPITREIVP